MTLLERFDDWDGTGQEVTREELRRAIAIAQAVDEFITEFKPTERTRAPTVFDVECRAYELLRGNQ